MIHHLQPTGLGARGAISGKVTGETEFGWTHDAPAGPGSAGAPLIVVDPDGSSARVCGMHVGKLAAGRCVFCAVSGIPALLRKGRKALVEDAIHDIEALWAELGVPAGERTMPAGWAQLIAEEPGSGGDGASANIARVLTACRQEAGRLEAAARERRAIVEVIERREELVRDCEQFERAIHQSVRQAPCDPAGCEHTLSHLEEKLRQMLAEWAVSHQGRPFVHGGCAYLEKMAADEARRRPVGVVRTGDALPGAFASARRELDGCIDEAVRRNLVPSTTRHVAAVNIALVGDIKSGKSSIGNILLRQRVLPTAFQPCTGRPVLVSAPTDGTTRKYVVLGRDGSREEHLADWPAERAIPTPAVVAPDAVWRGRQDDAVDRIEVFIPNSPLLDAGVCLLDLPGANRSEPMDDRIVQMLSSVSLAIFVLHTEQGLTVTAGKLLTKLRAVNVQTPVLFVVNKTDLMHGEMDDSDLPKIRDDTLAALYGKISEQFSDLRRHSWSDSPLFAAVSACDAGIALAQGRGLPGDFRDFERKLFELLPDTLELVIDDAASTLWTGFDHWLASWFGAREAGQVIRGCQGLEEMLGSQATKRTLVRAITESSQRAFETVNRDRQAIVDQAAAHPLLCALTEADRLQDGAAFRDLFEFTVGLFNDRVHAIFRSEWQYIVGSIAGQAFSGIHQVFGVDHPGPLDTVHGVAARICRDILGQCTRIRPTSRLRRLAAEWKSLLGVNRPGQETAADEQAWKRRQAEGFLSRLQEKRRDIAERFSGDLANEFVVKACEALEVDRRRLQEIVGGGPRPDPELFLAAVRLSTNAKAVSNAFVHGIPRFVPGTEADPGGWTWRGAPCDVRAILCWCSLESTRLFLSLFASRASFDVTRRLDERNRVVMCFITKRGKMPLSTSLSDRMHQMELEDIWAPPPETRMIFPPGPIDLKTAVEQFVNGFIPVSTHIPPKQKETKHLAASI